MRRLAKGIAWGQRLARRENTLIPLVFQAPNEVSPDQNESVQAPVDSAKTESTKFKYDGRSYKLTKRKGREHERDAPYQVIFKFGGKVRFHSTRTNIIAVAKKRAIAYIATIKAGKWEDAAQMQSKSPKPTKVPTFGEIAEVYQPHDGTPGIAGTTEDTARNNVWAMGKILKTVLGVQDPETVPLSKFDKMLAVKFQDEMARESCERSDKDEETQRFVRDRALNSSKSVILQARSLFNTKSELPAKYAERGLPIPACVQEFMTAKLRGKDKQQHEYLPPPDAVIQRTFKEIEKLKDVVPQTYIAFWLACGCGLRRKEIFRARWEYFILRDGQPWFSGGIGKNGQTIEVPVQKRAWENLKPLRQEEGPCLGVDATMEYARHINGWLTAQGWRTEKKLHELRAYVGSLIYIKDPVAAMKFMRHSSIKITEKFYARYGKVKTPNVL